MERWVLDIFAVWYCRLLKFQFPFLHVLSVKELKFYSVRIRIILYLFGSIVVNLLCKNSHYHTVQKENFNIIRFLAFILNAGKLHDIFTTMEPNIYDMLWILLAHFVKVLNIKKIYTLIMMKIFLLKRHEMINVY